MLSIARCSIIARTSDRVLRGAISAQAAFSSVGVSSREMRQSCCSLFRYSNLDSLKLCLMELEVEKQEFESRDEHDNIDVVELRSEYEACADSEAWF